MRFLVGSSPVAVEPPTTHITAYVDYFATRFFFRAIRPGDWVADVGAFQGTYSVLAAHATGSGGRVFAFEPFPGSHPILERNLRLNHVEHRTEIVRAAVGECVGEAVFYSAGARNENSLFRAALPKDVALEAFRVPVTTLDQYFAAYGRDPDVVKIDAEGAELSVLRGAERLVRSAAVILCEFHPYTWREAGFDAATLRTWLSERGRLAIDLRTGGEPAEFTYGVYELRRVAVR